MKLTYEVEVEIPTVPNFLIIKSDEAYNRTEGAPKIAVKDCTKEQLITIADEWKRLLLAKIFAVPTIGEAR